MKVLISHLCLTVVFTSVQSHLFASSFNEEVEELVNTLDRNECNQIDSSKAQIKIQKISTERIFNAAISEVLSTQLGRDLYRFSTSSGTRIEALTSIEHTGNEDDLIAEYDGETDLIVFGTDFLKGFVAQKRTEGLSQEEAENEVGRLVSPILINELTHAYVRHKFDNEFEIVRLALAEEELLSDAFTSAFLKQITDRDPDFIEGAKSLSYAFENDFYRELYRDSEWNLGDLYKGYLSAANASSSQDLKRRLIDRYSSVLKDEYSHMIQQAFSNGSIGVQEQNLGRVTIPARDVDSLIEYIDSQIMVASVYLAVLRDPDGDVARAQGRSLFGTKNRPSEDQIKNQIRKLEKAKEVVQNPTELDKVDSLLQNLFARAYKEL